MTFDEIQKQEGVVNQIRDSAQTDEEWQNFNTEWNKLGIMIEAYGRIQYNREMKINIILSEDSFKG